MERPGTALDPVTSSTPQCVDIGQISRAPRLAAGESRPPPGLLGRSVLGLPSAGLKDNFTSRQGVKDMNQRVDELRLAFAAAALLLLSAGAAVVHADEHSSGAPAEQRAAMLDQMKSRMQDMQALMARMQQTSDRTERQKLMTSHMQLMQEQMTAMRSMGGGTMHMMHGRSGMGMGSGMPAMNGAKESPKAPGPRHQAMEDRVDMLQMMMEQMMGQMQMQMQSRPGRSAD